MTNLMVLTPFLHGLRQKQLETGTQKWDNVAVFSKHTHLSARAAGAGAPVAARDKWRINPILRKVLLWPL
ncbi:MAG: hypothetical protein SPL69_12695, partial [Succinivibrionaceae bacterium]|nr:hypothetical protein [Succinivibrionaceae bacterium]